MSSECCGQLHRTDTPSASGAATAVTYINFATDVVLTNGSPGPTVVTGPAIPLDGTSGAILDLTIDIEIVDVAPSLIPLTVTFTWGNLTSTVVTQLQSIVGTTQERITLPIPIGAAPGVGTATSLTFTATLGVGQQLTIPAGINNYSIFHYAGPWTFNVWA